MIPVPPGSLPFTIYDHNMLLEVLTPERKIYAGEVYGVQLPGIDGSFEILDKHAPLIAALGNGKMKVLKDKAHAEFYTISGGFVEVLRNKATVLVEGAVAVEK
ncbi:F-type H+-transporting ATPase subunit epsilon [Chitinophaga sp. W3I9]